MTTYNNTVTIPATYFKQHTDNEYHDWALALFREFVQNGRDCGSSRIDINIQPGTLTVANNGSVMDIQTMTNVLLSLGGTKKEEGSVGGFGQAKNLLYFRWNNWTVQSGNWTIHGSGPNYADPIYSEQAFEGTTSTIYTPDDYPEFFERQARKYLDRCFLGPCHTYITTQDNPSPTRIQGSIQRGRVIRSLKHEGEEFAKVYFNKSQQDPQVRVYSGGLYMFSVGYHQGMQGSVSIDILKASTEVLTANRDGIQWTYKREVEKFVSELTRDQRKATKEREEEIWHSEGTGGISVGQVEQVSGFQEPTTTVRLEKIRDNMQDTIAAYINLYPTDNNQAHIDGKPMAQHSYAIVIEKDCKLTKSRIKSIMKTDRAKTLFVQWAAIVQLALECSNFVGEFTPGFIFSEETKGQFRKAFSRVTILLNPEKIERGQSSRCQLDSMMQVAIHEVCHHGNEYHDEDFILSYHKLWTECMKRYPDFQQLAYPKVAKMVREQTTEQSES